MNDAHLFWKIHTKEVSYSYSFSRDNNKKIFRYELGQNLSKITTQENKTLPKQCSDKQDKATKQLSLIELIGLLYSAAMRESTQKKRKQEIKSLNNNKNSKTGTYPFNREVAKQNITL